MKRIIVTIDRRGKTKIEAEGFSGTECLDATKELEKAFGAVESRTAKTEMYVANVTGEVKAGR